MFKYTKHIALMTSAMLLCGCTGSAGSSSELSQPETTDTSQTSSEASQVSESLSPAGESAVQGTLAGDNAAATDESISDVASDNGSEYSDIFELNGTWREINELPFELDSYTVPMLGRDDFLLCECRNGKMYFIEFDMPGTEMSSQAKLWSYTPETGEEKLLYDLGGPVRKLTQYVDDKYLAVETVEDENRLIVIDLQTGNVVFDTPEHVGNIRFFPGSGVRIVNDVMYIIGEYTMPEFDRSFNAGMMVDLNSGEVSLCGLNQSAVQYGVGDVCFLTGDTETSISGVTLPVFEAISEDSYIWNNLINTYYPTSVTKRYEDALGVRCAIDWTDASDNSHKIGQTAFSVEVAEDCHMNRDHIFAARLWKQLPRPEVVRGIRSVHAGRQKLAVDRRLRYRDGYRAGFADRFGK